MLSLRTLLNPAPPGRETGPSFQPSPTPSSPAFSNVTDNSALGMDRPIMPPIRLGMDRSMDRSNMAKSKLRGPIKYPPFENLTEESLSEIRRFQIMNFGYIKQSCAHIPYNSGKKDFFEKTGRESFEGAHSEMASWPGAADTNYAVFRYEFTIPGQTTEYIVMWDYNVGLVRMTPFFKCCHYGKTVPAKMLGLNPGLKDITHSITGGSIAAQGDLISHEGSADCVLTWLLGYWMPFDCARAVCTTFCYQIAGALIPIFGPTFPSECFPPGSPEFGRMIIDPRLVIEATQEAEISRRVHMNNMAPNLAGATSFPRSERTATLSPFASDERKMQFRPRLTCDPSWMMDSTDNPYYSTPNSASSMGSGLHGYMITSRPPSSYTPVNHLSPQNDDYCPDPFLSTVPGKSVEKYMTPSWGPKRRFESEERDYIFRHSASPMVSNTSYVRSSSAHRVTTPEPTAPRTEARVDDLVSDEDAAATLLLLVGEVKHQGPLTMSALRPLAPTRPGSSGSSVVDEHQRKRRRGNEI
ncbi:hypothetical protein AK830_g10157 [Neonectria ditissima]|uniref:HTH APSES-type domain-containing protein n=1 Tax=Neonectria ditissima TaxID=78410 RepID=A0A0P7BB12_9HYPO|nr:hypothetical protein AK830_g10157 [Neonectria ditissima]